MEDLLKAFFERDLSEAEERQLDSLLESSSQDAFQFLEIAKALYLQTGLPNPENPPTGGGGSPPWSAGPKILWSLFTGALITGSVWWASERYGLSPEHSLPVPNVTVIAPVLKTDPFPPPQKVHSAVRKDVPLMPPATVQPQPYVAGKKYEGLSVIIKQAATGLMTVRILDAQGREVRLLYANILDPGEWNFSWDGRQQDGRWAEAGDYQVETQSGKTVLRKEIKIVRELKP